MTSTAVYHKLKKWIYRGQLTPGQRLVEMDLAHRVGTSRIPLRESLRRLESEGLVRSIPHKATFVAELTPADIREILFMRRLLEP
ncbi:GntR family transcriptional regulator, partial [Phycisphaerales bacterium AB-hyl4]